jgi:peptide deformylase
MAILSLSYLGDPVLRRKAEPVAEVTDEHRRLIRDMYETMHANNGVGLAAPQVGVSLRIAVLGIPQDDEHVLHLALVNPEWSNPRGQQSDDEGCLSVPNLYDEMRRALQVDVRARNESGEEIAFTCEGLFARAVQHEVDHLNGILFIDRLGALRRQRHKKRLREIEATYRPGAVGSGRPARGAADGGARDV